jgi:hypothetical protein
MLLAGKCPARYSLCYTRDLSELLKISQLVAIAATVAIVCTVGGILAIPPKMNVPSNGPGQSSTANSFY